MTYTNLDVLQSIAKLMPLGEWVSEDTFVVIRDTTSVAWMSAQNPETSRVVQISYSFACNEKWLKSITGRLFVWLRRRNIYPYLITIDDGELNLRVWTYLIGENYFGFDPREQIRAMGAIGREIQLISQT